MVPISDDLNDAPCGYLEYSASGIITNINQTLVGLLACNSREEVIGNHIETLFTTAGRIFYQTHFFPLVKLQGKANEIFFTLKGRNGDRIPAICNAVLTDKDIIRCIFIPVPERRKYEQELLDARRHAETALQQNKDLLQARADLEHSNMLLDRKSSRLIQIKEDIAQFSKSISHDLQEPIRKIAVLADKAATQAAHLLPPDSIRDLQRIDLECRNLRSLIIYLERFISLNTVTEDAVLLSLDQVVKDAFELASPHLDNVSIDWQVEDLPMIEGYPLQIALLFYNLIDNAIKFRDEGSPLKIRVSASIVEQNTYRALKEKYRYTEFAKIAIEDNGRGFLSKDQQRVFQLQKLVKDKGVNLGFGLALCKKIADNHYGRIAISSEIGKGTVVTIFLPIKQKDNL